MKIVEIAKSYIGKTEKPGNQGFNDSVFEKKMEAVGFQKGQAWCSYFVELVAKEAYPELSKELDKLCNASAVKTFSNFKSSRFKTSDKPSVGDIVIWQQQKNGVAQWTGHAAIVVSASGDTFSSVEGNTNSTGGREGFEVALKARNIKKVKNGLQVLGFITLS